MNPSEEKLMLLVPTPLLLAVRIGLIIIMSNNYIQAAAVVNLQKCVQLDSIRSLMVERMMCLT
jgi:hypothetical protein